MDAGMIVFLSIVAANIIAAPFAIRWLDMAFKNSRPSKYDMDYRDGKSDDKFYIIMPVVFSLVFGGVPLVALFALCANAYKNGTGNGPLQRFYSFIFPAEKEYHDQIAARDAAEKQVQDLWKMLNKTPKKSTDYDIIKTAYDAAVEEHKQAEVAASKYYSRY
ncbi:hypothetical protein PP304_gp160 [Gordonia phage Phendrix]|uniref:Uncharacterized protein n=1 Tax=Gordonia phage Phendrix TaxID=2593335 RepID=A0A514U1B3_9CAUD|nr:hypothetical protein PP304_gp160 [Gordonia phage Phendrix]QDK02709.1 hypothetical protein SEA_PHENDRIX_193 [Gordonia phage Phendrix]